MSVSKVAINRPNTVTQLTALVISYSGCTGIMFTVPLIICLSRQTGQEHELIEVMPLLEWFANSYKKFGATLEIVTDKSQEGSQFVKGFGGIGGDAESGFISFGDISHVRC